MNCIFNENTVHTPGNWRGGGAIYLQGLLMVLNSRFYENKVVTEVGHHTGGGAIYSTSNYAHIINSRFVKNFIPDARGGGGAIYNTFKLVI